VTRKPFTLEEARALLPWVKKQVAVLMAIEKQLLRSKEMAERLARLAPFDSGAPESNYYLEMMIARQTIIQRIEEKGCVVKSVGEGLVDFPHIREGREVYLCWKHGEASIGYWHELDEGFANRIPLEDQGEEPSH
jgi:hypothetical protein